MNVPMRQVQTQHTKSNKIDQNAKRRTLGLRCQMYNAQIRKCQMHKYANAQMRNAQMHMHKYANAQMRNAQMLQISQGMPQMLQMSQLHKCSLQHQIKCKAQPQPQPQQTATAATTLSG